MRSLVYGVDFSGAAEAGNHIWITEARASKRSIAVSRCFPATQLTLGRTDRDGCLKALVEYVAARPKAVFGCDFPFGLPRDLVEEPDWDGFIGKFGRRHDDPGRFRAYCLARASGRELRRASDRTARAPFSAYNIRLHRQTFHGLRDLLWPLVRSGRASVLPMHRARDDRAWVIEICPASTLKAQDLYRPYKGMTRQHRLARRQILDGLTDRALLRPLTPDIRETALANAPGDALDSIVAAIATARSLAALVSAGVRGNAIDRLEGRIFV